MFLSEEMLRTTTSAILFSSICLAAVAAQVPAELFSPLVQQKVLRTFNSLPKPVQYPQYTTHTGDWSLFVPDTWTSGFFPDTLYELDRRQTLCGGDSTDWVALGRQASQGLAGLPGHNSQGHDVGFLSFPFVEELKRNPNSQSAKDVINAFARDLANRFIPAAGVTRSWDNPANDPPSRVQVIIDNLMNLDLLWTSAELTGNNTLKTIAEKHADTTIKNHIRANGGTWHVVEYNGTTGGIISKHTAQGFADNRQVCYILYGTPILSMFVRVLTNLPLCSTWSRGQAWAIFGYAQLFGRFQKQTYLDTSRRLADYFISHIPADGIVPWDFNAPLQDPKVPGGVRPADTAAAMIAATGLLLLSDVETDGGNKQKWKNAAVKIVSKTTQLAWRPEWQSLLSNGTVHWPANNYLTGTVYGDYYFVRVGNDLVERGLAEC